MHNPFKNIVLPSFVQKALSICKILLRDIERSDLLKHASAMAYVTLFSLVPSLAATFAVISLFKPFLGQDSALLMRVKDFVLSNLAAGSGEQVISYIDNFINNLDMTKIGLTGFAGLLFSLIMLLRQIEIALNTIYMVKKPRHIFVRFVYFWTFLTLGTLIIGLAVGIVSGFNVKRLNPFQEVDLSAGQEFVADITPFVTTLLFFTFLYKIVPNCYVRLKSAFFGAFPAAILFTIAASSYGWFTSRFTTYQAIYGALAAIPLTLMWLYILWVITLFGALLAWRYEESFDITDESQPEGANLSSCERLRNHQLQGFLPYICLLIVFDVFEKGTGKGITGSEISKALNIPSHWVSEALESLLALGLVVTAKGEHDQEYDTLHSCYFPTVPAHAQSADEVMRKLFSDSQHWMENWDSSWPTDLKPALGELFNCLIAEKKKSIQDVLTRLAQRT